MIKYILQKKKFRNVVTFNECDHEKYFEEVPNDLALFSSLVLKTKQNKKTKISCIHFDSEPI